MILVTGANGQVGTAFRSLLPDATFFGRSELDLRDTASIGPALAAVEPGAIINCAAYTAVDRAETDEATATVVNGTAVGEMAVYAATAAIPFVTYSTDYVFDGTASQPYVESSPTAPINAYGRSKLAGEHAALDQHAGALVIRTSWVISATHPNFVGTMIDLARTRSLTVVNDQWGCPTIAVDLARATLEALEHRVSGILHLTNQGATTWYELARRSLELAGLDPGLVQPCATADYRTPAPRPAYSVLGSERMSAVGVEPLPRWEDSLATVVAGQRNRLAKTDEGTANVDADPVPDSG
jgi:dTDP-4-dehydrorhamnose reductase